MLFVLHLCKIMVENTKCDTVTIDFSSDTTKCKICQKLVHYSCVEVNLLSNFMFDVAYCWYSDHCYDAFAIMYTNDDQIVTMNAISNTPSNFDFYHLILALAITASSRKYVWELVERHGHSKWRYIVIYILPIVLIIF